MAALHSFARPFAAFDRDTILIIRLAKPARRAFHLQQLFPLEEFYHLVHHTGKGQAYTLGPFNTCEIALRIEDL